MTERLCCIIDRPVFQRKELRRKATGRSNRFLLEGWRKHLKSHMDLVPRSGDSALHSSADVLISVQEVRKAGKYDYVILVFSPVLLLLHICSTDAC